MSQTVISEKPLEERVYQSDRPGNHFYLEKGIYGIPLPCKSGTPIQYKNRYVEVAAKLDNVLTKYYELVGANYIYLRNKYPTGSKKVMTIIRHCNKSHILSVLEKYSKDFVNMSWVEFDKTPKLGVINHTEDNEISINVEGEIQTFVEVLLGRKTNPVIEEQEFYSFIEAITTALDNLFEEQGIKSTATKKHNLISLVINLPRYVIRNPGIQKLLETTAQSHTIDNPNLIHLAAKGVNGNLLQMFYAYDVYPQTTEEMLELVDIPIEMLYGIWNGKR